MTDLPSDVVPAALAVALSPIPIVAIVVVLSAPRARRAGPAFAAGWIVGLTVLATAIVLLAATAGAAGDDDGVDVVRLVIGVVFLLMAARQWTKRNATAEPSWMATIAAAGPLRALGLGAALSAGNPKNLALTITAGAAIAEADLSPAGSAGAIAVFTAIGSATVVALVATALAGGAHATRPLATIKTFMSEHSAVLLCLILLALGVKLIAEALL